MATRPSVLGAARPGSGGPEKALAWLECPQGDAPSSWPGGPAGPTAGRRGPGRPPPTARAPSCCAAAHTQVPLIAREHTANTWEPGVIACLGRSLLLASQLPLLNFPAEERFAHPTRPAAGVGSS